jgi:hypothetical protein
MLKSCLRLTVQIIAIHAPWRPERSPIDHTAVIR